MCLDVLICWSRIVIVEVNVVALACCRSIGSFVGGDLFRCAVYPAQSLKHVKHRVATEQAKYDVEKNSSSTEKTHFPAFQCSNVIFSTYRKSYEYAVLTTSVNKQVDFSCLGDCHRQALFLFRLSYQLSFYLKMLVLYFAHFKMFAP